MSEMVTLSSSTVRTPVAVTFSVWKALFLREALTRLSYGRAAWLWLLFEPAAHVALLMIIFSTVRKRSILGVEFALFLAIGVLGFFLFKKAVQRSLDAISANSGLFVYRQVKPVDTVVVRVFLEGIIQCFVAIALLAVTSLFGYDVLPGDPMGVMAAWMLLWLFGLGVGLMLSVGTTLVPEIGKLANIVFTPLYFVSGVLFSPFMLPPWIQKWLLLNPIIHGLESLRADFFPGYHLMPGIKLSYLAAFALGSLFLGLALHVRFSNRLLVES